MKVRKKPVVVEAIQWKGNNLQDIRDFVGDQLIENYIDYLPVREKECIKLLSSLKS